MKNRIYLSPPHMAGNEKEFLDDAFESNWIAPLGPYVDSFESEMSKYLDVPYCVALNSGTAALHLSLIALGIKKDDLVVCPSLTFAATANAIMYVQGIPIFVDSDSNTWVADLNALEYAFKKYKPKAFISVDLYGNSCNYQEIEALCSKYGVMLIEDAAEALGSVYLGRKCGGFGEIGILSFNGNKIITSSGGGMLVSQNKMYVDEARFLSTQAREAELHYEHKKLGYNYRMSNICAAIGYAQLQNIEHFKSRRREIFHKYYSSLSKISGIKFIEETESCISNHWLTSATVDKNKLNLSNMDIIEALQRKNIEARPVWKPMHLQPYFKGSRYIKVNQEDISSTLYKNGICLPSGSSISIEDQDRIINIIISTIDSI